MITIDGSQGEGGGQILRTALALSLVTGQAFRLDRIRAGRKKPGLLRQHLTAVQAAATIGGATVDGADLGSLSLTFKPGQVRPGDYSFAVGTAGSATLVCQTILPALMQGSGQSTLVLEGGTHNPLAPPFEFLAKTFLPVLARMGPQVTATLDRPGFYPAGGGRFRVVIDPAGRLRPIELLERGAVRARRARVLLAHLPDAIGERQQRLLQEKLNWPEDVIEIVRVENSAGPGNAVLAEVECDAVCEVFTGYGERDVPSGKVVGGLVDEVREYLASGAPVGEHLADQLMIPFALAGSGCYRAVKASLHARTNAEIIGRFVDTGITLEPEEGSGALFRFGV